MNMSRRFWAKVDKRGPNECWPWTGNRKAASVGDGYGRFWIGQQRVYAHRMSFALTQGEMPTSDVVIRHTCDNPPCVNPRHLLAGTPRDNVRDMVERGRGYVGPRPFRCCIHGNPCTKAA